MTKIIPVHSFRGGTGKSNTTANVATAVAAMGQKVGIIDTDIQSPGIHILFNLSPKSVKKTLNDYLWNRCTLQESSYDVTPAPIKAKKGQILLIPASMDISEISKILRDGYNVKRLQDGLKKVGEQLKLDYLFIDTHPGINEETLLSLSLAHTLVVILRPDQQDFQGTAVIVDIARRLNVNRLLLVVNRVPAKFIPEQVKEQVEKTYQAKVAALLPNSEEMMELASRDLFYLRYPDHVLSQAYQAIAQQIHQPSSGEANPFLKNLFQRRWGYMVPKNKNVLVIDDQPDMCLIIQAALEELAGWNVVSTYSGEQGLDFLNTFTFDVILLDVSMPHLDGISVYKRIKENDKLKGIPVILITAKVSNKDYKRYQELDVAGVIAKPFSAIHLAEQIARILNWK